MKSNLSSYVEKLQNTGLEHLTDDELLEFCNLSSELTARENIISQYSMDTKGIYHVVRLSLECEQILTTGNLDLECNSELFKAIRRGEWTYQKLREWFDDKEKHLEEAYSNSTLRHESDEETIKGLLLKCIETHYGSLDKAIKTDNSIEKLKDELLKVLGRF